MPHAVAQPSYLPDPPKEHLVNDPPDHGPVATPGHKSLSGRPKVLVVDDDPLMRLTLSYFFGSRGFHVALSAGINEAKILFPTETWTAVVCDYQLRDGNGLQLHDWIRDQAGSSPSFLLMSGVLNAQAARGVEFLAKPFALTELDARTRVWLGLSETSNG